jgi:hypothetical protein
VALFLFDPVVKLAVNGRRVLEMLGRLDQHESRLGVALL